MRILFSFILLMSCDQNSGGARQSIYTIKTEASVPACTTKLEGVSINVLETNEQWTCKSNIWNKLKLEI